MCVERCAVDVARTRVSVAAASLRQTPPICRAAAVDSFAWYVKNTLKDKNNKQRMEEWKRTYGDDWE